MNPLKSTLTATLILLATAGKRHGFRRSGLASFCPSAFEKLLCAPTIQRGRAVRLQHRRAGLV